MATVGQRTWKGTERQKKEGRVSSGVMYVCKLGICKEEDEDVERGVIW